MISSTPSGSCCQESVSKSLIGRTKKRFTRCVCRADCGGGKRRDERGVRGRGAREKGVSGSGEEAAVGVVGSGQQPYCRVVLGQILRGLVGADDDPIERAWLFAVLDTGRARTGDGLSAVRSRAKIERTNKPGGRLDAGGDHERVELYRGREGVLFLRVAS